jgi:DNA polymerase III epsilon subunit-like protein
VVAFDAANEAHVSEVLRVFFSPDIVSCGIVLCAYDTQERTMQVLCEDYAVYRPSAEYKASIVARAIHGLDAAVLGEGADVAVLYARLSDIMERHPAVVFVAHYAPHDRVVLLQVIDNHVADAAGGSDGSRSRLLRLRRELQDARRWTCTWQRSVLLMADVCGRSLKKFKKPTVYVAVVGTPLQTHHNARTDVYACAVILCRLLGCDDQAVRGRMTAITAHGGE